MNPYAPQADSKDDRSQPVKVLVVDDSAFVRYTLCQGLAEQPGIQVVGAARDGQEAIEMIPRLNPDVVTLDVEMPRLDGLSALKMIMADFPRPVVMLSSLTQEGAVETIQALTYGAVDFIPKPAQKSNIGNVMSEAAARIRKAASARVAARPREAAPVFPRGPQREKTLSTRRRDDPIVVIGSSTGGPRALVSVLSGLNREINASFVIVQHMPAGFTRSLAERLDGVCPLRVKEVQPGDTLVNGQVLMAAGGFHLTFEGGEVAALNQNPTVHGVRPSIDVTVNSLAQVWGSRMVSVTLTGMGSDGTHGAVLVHNSGGKVIAEDESSAVVWGMPRCVFEAGVADEVVPLERIPFAIDKAVRRLAAGN